MKGSVGCWRYRLNVCSSSGVITIPVWSTYPMFCSTLHYQTPGQFSIGTIGQFSLGANTPNEVPICHVRWF